MEQARHGGASKREGLSMAMAGCRAGNWLVSCLVAGPSPKTCVACGRRIAPSEVYYRFTLVLQGEQDVLAPSGSSGTVDDLPALMRQLEEGPQDAREWDEQVHWERAGVICTACRAVVMRSSPHPPRVRRAPTEASHRPLGVGSSCHEATPAPPCSSSPPLPGRTSAPQALTSGAC